MTVMLWYRVTKMIIMMMMTKSLVWFCQGYHMRGRLHMITSGCSNIFKV